MGGKFGKLVLLFRREMYFHISQSRGVIPACQRAAGVLGIEGKMLQVTKW
jgi:hypothetical protein